MPRKSPPGNKLPPYRPLIDIDWKKVDTMILSDCSGTEIAGELNVCSDTFYDRFRIEYGVPFSEYRPRRKSGGDAMLKVKQFQSALRGNSTMLKLLGEERLGQGRKDIAYLEDEKTSQFETAMKWLQKKQNEEKKED